MRLILIHYTFLIQLETVYKWITNCLLCVSHRDQRRIVLHPINTAIVHRVWMQCVVFVRNWRQMQKKKQQNMRSYWGTAAVRTQNISVIFSRNKDTENETTEKQKHPIDEHFIIRYNRKKNRNLQRALYTLVHEIGVLSSCVFRLYLRRMYCTYNTRMKFKI